MEREHQKPLFPVFVKLDGRLCTVVGGGEVAARKVVSLLDSGARVRLVAPRLCASLCALAEAGRVEHVARQYAPGDLEGSTLAVGATDDASVNQAVYQDGEGLGILVNVVDQPELCGFYVPSTLDRGPVRIAVSTTGTSPALARRLREILEDAVPPEYGELASLLGSLRAEASRHVPSGERGRRWRNVVDGEALCLLRQGRRADAERTVRELLGLAAPRRPDQCAPARVRIGTRGSALALAQSSAIAECLRQLGAQVDIVTIHTTGDRRAELSGAPVGMFVREIEQALLAGDVDLAVHSMKDLPTGTRPGLVVAAIPPREDPSDVIISSAGQGLDELPPGSRVATSSPRRVTQLRSHRPDLVFVPVKGNVDTRVRKLRRGDFDALILAYAGLARLGILEVVTEQLSPDICLPAPGQGALALQVREADVELRHLLAQLDHGPSRLAVEAERAFLAGMGGGCSIPLGALGIVDGDRFILRGAFATADGTRLIRDAIEGPPDSALDLGAALAERVLAVTSSKAGTD